MGFLPGRVRTDWVTAPITANGENSRRLEKKFPGFRTALQAPAGSQSISQTQENIRSEIFAELELPSLVRQPVISPGEQYRYCVAFATWSAGDPRHKAFLRKLKLPE
jgi:hypothetical protein